MPPLTLSAMILTVSNAFIWWMSGWRWAMFALMFTALRVLFFKTKTLKTPA
jgi:hypothetical protein